MPNTNNTILVLNVKMASLLVSNKKKDDQGNPMMYTKLYVQLGNDLAQVICTGDRTALDGAEGVPFQLCVRKNQLALFLYEER